MINSISFSGKNCNLKQFPNNCFEHGPLVNILFVMLLPFQFLILCPRSYVRLFQFYHNREVHSWYHYYFKPRGNSIISRVFLLSFFFSFFFLSFSISKFICWKFIEFSKDITCHRCMIFPSTN